MLLKNKTVAVTGASSGIGSACCELLKERGAAVIGLDIKPPASDGLDEFISYDQGNPDAIDRAIQRVPQLTGLMNIAGIAPSSQVSAADVLRINFFGVRYLTEALQPKLSPGAAIVNMTSGTAAGWTANVQTLTAFMALRDVGAIDGFVASHGVVKHGLGDNAAYPLSKQLLNFWTLQLATDWREHRIRVNAIAPAAVDTPIVADFLASFGEEAARRMETFGSATPQNIAKASVFLLSDDAAWINGAVLPVDGGAIAAGTLAKLSAARKH